MGPVGCLRPLPGRYTLAADSSRTRAPFSTQVQYPGSEPEVRANKQGGGAKQLCWFLGRACCIPGPSALFLMSLSADRCFKHCKKERGSHVTHKSNKSGSPNPGLDATNTQKVAEMKSPSCQ